MPRKRKIATALQVDAINENEEVEFPKKSQHPLYVILQNAQINEAFHSKYIKELQQLYVKIGHKEFMAHTFKSIEQLMVKNETHEYANVGLKFIAKYLTSYQGDENVHPTLADSFEYITSRISLQPVVRFRLCEFVNLILNSLGTDASLDDNICDNVLKYMSDRLKDISPMVREQAVYAMQRLQTPENPIDPIVKVYQYHLSHDPSTLVRKAVITSIGRNVHTIPSIIERLWDVDERVRRHVYIQMCSYPVHSYKVSQRLTFLEQGLNDVENVKKIVVNILLPQWIGSYNKMLIPFVGGLKLDGEINRFRKTAKLALLEIFKNQKDSDLIEQLQLDSSDDSEFKCCIPFNRLTVESSLYWSTLLEYFQESDDKSDEADSIIPELSTFCSYIKIYCEKFMQIDAENWQILNIQHIIRSLSEILTRFDTGDEIGRQELKLLIGDLVTNKDIEENTIKNFVTCLEKLYEISNDRLQVVVDLLQNTVNINSSSTTIDLTNASIISLLEHNQDLKVEVSSLKMKIMDLQESETEYINRKDYAGASKITENLAIYNEQLTTIIKQELSKTSMQQNNISTLQAKKITKKMQIRSLQMIFYTCVSRKVQSLIPNMCQLYKNFICRQTESSDFIVRNWALKCATTFSLLYDQLAKATYKVLNDQFFRNQNITVWTTSISAIFELIDKYGFSYFDANDNINDKSALQQSSSTTTATTTKDKANKTNTRQLFNTVDNLNFDEDEQPKNDNCLSIMYLFSHFLEECDDKNMSCALIDGFCRLILHGHYCSEQMISKLLLKFYNPIVSQEINQILGIFFESLVIKKRQECLQPALFPTLISIMEAPNESPLREIKPEKVLKFVISTTRPFYSSPGLNIHNTFAMKFLTTMLENPTSKEWIRLLASQLKSLEIGDDQLLRNDLKTGFNQLLELPLEPKSIANIRAFIDVLDGKASHLFSSSNVPQLNKDKDLDDETNDLSGDEDEHHDEIVENETIENTKNAESQLQSNSSPIIASPPRSNEKDKNTTQDNVSPKSIEKNKKTTPDNVSPKSIEANRISSVNTSPIAAANEQINISVTIPTPTAAIAPTKTKKKENVSLTPTTYGLQNSTQARYLRKSQNVRQPSSDDIEMGSPSKVRRGRPARQTTKKVSPPKLKEKNDNNKVLQKSVTDAEIEDILSQDDDDDDDDDEDIIPSSQPNKLSSRAQKSLFQNPTDNHLDEILPASPNSSYRTRRADKSKLNNTNNKSNKNEEKITNKKTKNKKTQSKTISTNIDDNRKSIDTSSSSVVGSPPTPLVVTAVVHHTKPTRNSNPPPVPPAAKRSSRVAQKTNLNSKSQTETVRKSLNKSSTTKTSIENNVAGKTVQSTRASVTAPTIETKQNSPKKKIDDSSSSAAASSTLSTKKTKNSVDTHKYKTRRAAAVEYVQNNVITRKKSLVVSSISAGSSRSNSIEKITSPRRSSLNTEKNVDKRKSVTNKKVNNTTTANTQKAKKNTTSAKTSPSKEIDEPGSRRSARKRTNAATK